MQRWRSVVLYYTWFFSLPLPLLFDWKMRKNSDGLAEKEDSIGPSLIWVAVKLESLPYFRPPWSLIGSVLIKEPWGSSPSVMLQGLTDLHRTLYADPFHIGLATKSMKENWIFITDYALFFHTVSPFLPLFPLFGLFVHEANPRVGR